MKNKFVAVLLMAMLVLAACAPTAAQPQSQDIDTIVQQTFVALTVQAAVSTSVPATQPPAAATQAIPTSAYTTGSIAGSLSYPADSVPSMRVVAYSATSNQYSFVDTILGQGFYQIDDLPAGTYTVVAYSLGGGSFPLGLAGGYTGAMRGNAADHALVTVTVTAGQITQNINLGDWTAPAATFPTMPGVVPPTVAASGPQPLKPEGGIAGNLVYPTDTTIPAMVVVAFSTQYYPNGNYYYNLTQPGDGTYEMVLPQGEYYIVAFVLNEQGTPTGVAGGYTNAVTCGLGPTCTDHSLIAVPVAAGGALSDITPSDWSAVEGTYPPYPLH